MDSLGAPNSDYRGVLTMAKKKKAAKKTGKKKATRKKASRK
jgi:hypothetical protein